MCGHLCYTIFRSTKGQQKVNKGQQKGSDLVAFFLRKVRKNNGKYQCGKYMAQIQHQAQISGTEYCGTGGANDKGGAGVVAPGQDSLCILHAEAAVFQQLRYCGRTYRIAAG